MKIEIFKNLPSEIIINIFSRLHLRAVARSKCVCKPWLHLLESNEFVCSHLAKSVPSLAVLTTTEDLPSCTIYEFEEGDELESHDLHYNQLTKFDFPQRVEIRGSANGLLFLFQKSEVHWVCNPITRDYIEVSCPNELIRPYPPLLNYPETIEENVYSYPHTVTYGFGVSKISGEFKVVRIFQDSAIVHGGPVRSRIIPESECHVHTLGTGSWRHVESGAGAAVLEYSCRASCVFLNGNLHWVASDSDEKLWISFFDLETERFSHFSTPPIFQEEASLISGLSALGDCLCLCDHTAESETVIWVMKEYGDEKSWSKEYVINMDPDLDIQGFELIYPLKLFQDGDILMLQEDRRLFYYSSKTGTTQEIDIFSTDHGLNAILLTPSFLSLKTFGVENAISF